MYSNYIKISLRNLWKNKSYTFINFVGLSLAFACSILLFLTSYQEFTFNGMHENKENIYRYYLKINEPDGVKYGSAVPSPVRDALINDHSDQIKNVTRVRDISFVVKYKEKTIDEEAVAVDPDYVEMFSFDFIKGSAETSLKDLNSIVLREDVAQNIFGKDDPIGKILNAELGNTSIPLTVTGITAKMANNTSIENEMMIRYELLPDYHEKKDKWNHSSSSLYVLAQNDLNQSELENSLKPFCPKYYKDAIAQLEKEGAKPDENGEIVSIRMLPFLDEHFDKNVGGRRSVSIVYPFTLLIISVFIIFIACINFVNLSISRSILRTKEVGIRKSLGALKSQIVGQFWGESLMVCLASFLIGVLLFWSLLPSYNALFNTKLDFSLIFDKNTLAILLISFLAITLLAGGYPAWFISKFNTVEILKGKLKSGTCSNTIRKVLIIKQFAISVLLISCTVIIWDQLHYLRTKPLGFEQEHVVSVPVGREIDGERMLSLLRAELSGNPKIKSISAADNNVGFGKDNYASKSQFGFVQEGKSMSTNGLFVDFDYIKTMGLKLKEGRDFSTSFPTDSTKACIINETMAKQLGGNQILGQVIDLNKGLTVVGIINDYHFESLKNNIEPITLMIKGFPYTHIFVKIASENIDATLSQIEKSYKKIAPNSEYLGSFLEENRNEQYQSERRFTQIFIYAASLAILLSCLGLFAISLITINQRIKEIGIRKVLGSSVSSLVWSLSKDYMQLVLISVCIAAPLAWYFMNQWLDDFAYRIDIGFWVFVLTGLVSILIAFLTMSYHSISAALMNPIKSLRSE